MENTNVVNAFSEGLLILEYGKKIAENIFCISDINKNPGIIKRIYVKKQNNDFYCPPCIVRFREEGPDDEFRISCLGKTEVFKVDFKYPFSYKKKIADFVNSIREGFLQIDFEAQIAEASRNLTREIALRIFWFYDDNHQYRKAFLWLKKLNSFGCSYDRDELIRWIRRGKGCHRDVFLANKMMGRYNDNCFDTQPDDDLFTKNIF